jgi:ADP-dependent NAD(P)H-hydrate dehydratase / NAD(P)H-hydrate epimerase
MRIVTTSEMRKLEQLTAESGLSYETMMDNAGRATAQAIKDRLTPKDGRILLLIGTGNNGGDGLVAARYLRLAGFEVACYAIKPRSDADPNMIKVNRLGIPVILADDNPDWSKLRQFLAGCCVIVDAILGTGAVGPLRGLVPQILDHITDYLRETRRKAISSLLVPESDRTDRKPLIVAVDLPSGLDADTGAIDEHALKADLTVTFGQPKFGHFTFPGAGYVGQLLVADIGLVQSASNPCDTQLATLEMVADWLPERRVNSHKGTFGSALVVGGSARYVGAPRLAAEAAYRVGAGLVTLAVPAAIYPSIAAQLPEATYLVLSDDLGSITVQATRLIHAHLDRYSALLLGPGLGTEPETAAFMASIFGISQRALGFRPDINAVGSKLAFPPTVIDADGLNLLSQTAHWWERLPSDCVLTPHPGEMARLCGCEIEQIQPNRIEIAREKAQVWQCTVVLKGAFTVVASAQGHTTVIPFANPLLAVAGTGDVLAGAIAGLLAQGMPAYQAAICGAYMHGLAGECRRRDIGEAGLLAHELLPLLATAGKSLRELSRQDEYQ